MGYLLHFVSKAKKFFVSSSTAKKKALNGKGEEVAGFDARSPGSGSKEDVFFDTRAWLESDCEDDFFSVNGEFTPSRGSTPNHQTSALPTPRLDKTFSLAKFSDSKAEPSPTGRKKLFEFFCENLQREGDGAPNAAEERADTNPKPDISKTNSEQPPKLLNGTPAKSGANSDRGSAATPRRDLKAKKEKSWKTAHCCLPSLQIFGYDERRQKMSPKPCTA